MKTRSAERRAAFAIALAALVAYAAALGGTFVYDDFHSVRDNPSIRSLANLPSFLWDVDAFSGSRAPMYRPLLLATLTVDHVLGGGAALAFKITDVLLHALGSVLVFAAARSLRARLRPALLAGLLFAVHPLAAEAVNFISSRSDQLVTIGILLAIRAHAAALAGDRRAPWLAAVATMIACGGKETGVVVPAVLVALAPARRRPDPAGATLRAAAARIAPAAAVALGYLIVRRALFGVATVAVPALSGGAVAGPGRGLAAQLTMIGEVLPRFVAQALVPLGQSADPYVPLRDGGAGGPWLALCGWASLAILTFLGLRRPRRAPAVFTGTVVAWAVALPWVVIPLNSPVNEHRFYGCLAGLALAAAALLPRRRLPAPVQLAAGALIALFALGATARSRLFEAPERLWQDALAKNGQSVAALRGLAQASQDRAAAALEAGDHRAVAAEVRRALDDAYRALARAPRSLPVLEGLIRYHLALGADGGQPMLAVALACRVVEQRPKDPFARIELARTWTAAGVALDEPRCFEAADEAAMSVLEIAAAKGLVYRTAAAAHSAAGDHRRALARLDEAIARGLDHRSVQLDRAAVLIELERRDESMALLQAVLREAPFDPQARALLARLSAATPR